VTSASKLACAGKRRSFWGSGVLAAALCLLPVPKVLGQGRNAQPRITAHVDDALRTLSPGNIHPLAHAQYDQGLVDPVSELDRITMTFRMTAAQQADLDVFLAQQQDRSSPNFHKWLTPEEYAARFGISQSDVATIAAWLGTQGLTVVETARSRNWVTFTGTVAQVQAAFRAEIHQYSARGNTYFANATEPSVPSAFSGLVLGFRGLNNYPVKPPRLNNMAGNSAAQPGYTPGTPSSSPIHYLAPDDFQTIYDLKALYSSGIDGTGQKIAIMGQTAVVATDIATFRSLSGLPASAPQMILASGSSDPGIRDGDVQEASLDLEWSGAAAPNATILYVYSTDVFGSLQYAIGQNLAPVMSISYGACEQVGTPSEITILVSLTEQANAQGITIVADSGDGGAADCDWHSGTIPAERGLTVELPASLPYVTGVGGTEFDEGNGAYWSATNNTKGGSALSYIPEDGWHDLANNTTLSGGGGASVIFPKPIWQTGTGVPADNARDVPDISLNASQGHDGYLVCTQIHPTSGGPLTSGCVNGFMYSNGNFTVFGGTSFGAPAFAGILALINQKTRSTGQGNANYILYPLAVSSPTAFHDITMGYNAIDCLPGTTDCPNGGSIGYNAGIGYDQVTGLGSIDGFNLVNAWSSIVVSPGSTPTLVSVTPNAVTAGSADFALTATGTGFAPSAQILWNGSALGVTMQSGGASTQIMATISRSLIAYGSFDSVTVANQSPRSGASSPQTITVTGSPPINDNFANAMSVTTTPFTSTVDNSGATTESSDPTPLCSNHSTNPRTKTVWWSLVPGTSGTIEVDTIGSAYDTILSVWTGTAGDLSVMACNDDITDGVNTQSQLYFSAIAGTKYYLMVSPFGPPASSLNQFGGKTVLNVSGVVTSFLSASPATQTVNAGASAAFQITNSSNLSFSLTCTGLPPFAACSPVTLANSSSANLAISTAARSAAAPYSFRKREPNSGLRLELFIIFFMLASLLSLLAARRRQTPTVRPVNTLLLVFVLFVAGCGGGSTGNISSGGNGGSGGGPSSPGTPAGTYTITITGTTVGLKQITSVTLTVN
jgi:hypothetical protein